MHTINGLIDNHHFYTVERDISNCMGSELASHSLTYFEHIRVYDDGQFSVVTNNSPVLRYCFETQLKMIAPPDPKYVSEKFTYFILPVDQYVQAMHDFKVYFNLGYMLNFVERYPGYVDVYCFGAEASNPSIMNFFLHELDTLHSLIQLFKDKCAHLIKSHDKHKLLLPELMRPDFTGLPLGTSVYENISFSKREWDCIKLLKEEYSAKKIANRLDISHRTVENYLASIKGKLQCNKSDIRTVLKQRMGIRV